MSLLTPASTSPGAPPEGVISQEPFLAHDYDALIAAGVYPQEWTPSRERYEDIVKAVQMQSYGRVWRIRYKSGGLAVNGYLVTPMEIRDRAHPFIVFNRGGNRNFSMLTAGGILRYMLPLSRRNNALVFASNYRGVDGGEGRDEFGGAEVEDVLALARIARAHGGWDRKRSLMLGASRGGMMTYLAIKNGVEVNSAAVIAGETDLWEGERERPVMKGEHAGTMPDYETRREEHLEARSAIRWPEALRVPLLLMHGDNDWRVNVSHSIRLADALKRIGSPHELVIYPGDDHGLNYNWEDVQARICGWLERWSL